MVVSDPDGPAWGADATFTTAKRGNAAPALSEVSVKPKVWAVNPRGKRERPVSFTRVRRGATFSYTLSAPGRVVFAIQRQTKGRKSGRKCRRATRRKRHGKPCKLFVRVGAFARPSTAGRNAKKFSGRIGRKKLRPGSYRAVLVAVDALGDRSASRRVSFRVVRG
jgi:hypothetical protein